MQRKLLIFFIRISSQIIINITLEYHQMQDKQKRPVKVGVLGDRKSGKTFLANKLAGKEVSQYTQTTQVANYSASVHQDVEFIYADNPSLENSSIVQIGSVHLYDVLLFLFKDCDSFTKLYQFLVTVKEEVDSTSNHHVKGYWEHLKKVVFVFSDHESSLPVQLDQLFPILKEEVQGLSKDVIVKEFTLRKEANNLQLLKSIIQQEPIFYENPPVTSIQGENEQTDLQKQEAYEYVSKTVSEPLQQDLNHQAQEGQVPKSTQEPKQEEPNNDNQLKLPQVKEEDITEKSLISQRRNRIYQKIQKSFFVQEALNEEEPEKQDKKEEESVQPEPKEQQQNGAPKQYEQVAELKDEEDQKVLMDFRKPSNEEKDAELSKQLDEKIERLQTERLQKIKEVGDVQSEPPSAPGIVDPSKKQIQQQIQLQNHVEAKAQKTQAHSGEQLKEEKKENKQRPNGNTKPQPQMAVTARKPQGEKPAGQEGKDCQCMIM